jgi:hypothetical protein
MADINVNPNLPLQQDVPPAPRMRRSSAPTGFLNSIYRNVKTPFEYGAWIFSPWKGPADTLRRIDEAADRGIQRAKTRGVALEPVAPQLHAELDQLLGTHEEADRTAAINAAQRGPIADIHPLLPDPEITRAPGLQERYDATDPKDQIILQRGRLAKKLSVFTVLLQMRERCGEVRDRQGNVEENNLALMNLVKKATEGDTLPTVWELFTSHYDLTFFQLIKAAWFYWVYYQTSIIDNTVSEYLRSFIDHLTKDLVKPNSETRTLLFRSLLKNVNQFLIADIQATKDFAYEKDHGDLEDYRNRAIERHYGFSLSELCRSFSESMVENGSPEVKFFEEFQKIPVLGWAFKAFQSLVNWLIIRRAMKSMILPPSLQSAVNKGLEATQPHNLPFSLALTRFFTKRLEELRKELKNPASREAKSEGKFPGTEALPETIKYLKIALALEGPEVEGSDVEVAQTPLELRRKFEEIEKDKGWGFKPIISKSIEKSINDAGDLLFRFLNKEAQSGKLFANLLELSTAPFSGEQNDPTLLAAQYKEEKSKLERTAEGVFKQLVNKGVSEVVNGTDTKESEQTASDSFDDQRVVVHKSVEELSAICTRMAQKVERSREAPTPENNVQTDIASVLQIMQALASRKELQEEFKNVKGVDQNAVWRVIVPLIERTESIQERVLKLQELQDHYPSHANVVRHLNEMTHHLRSIRNQFHAQPRHLQNPLIQSLGQTADEITQCLGAKAPLRLKLQEFIIQISELSENVVKEQQAIDAIHRLYPPRDNAEEDAQEGLLDQMLNYERGVHPQGFKPKACLSEIGKYLVHFPAEERIELERIIGNGSNLRTKWTVLGDALQRIYTRHTQAKNRDSALLDQALDAANNWVQEKTTKYNLVKQEDHRQMRAEMETISTEMAALKKAADEMELNLATSLSPRANQAARLSLPVVAGVAGFAVAGPAGAVGASLLTGGVVKWLHGMKGSSNDSSLASIGVKAGVVAAGTLAAWYGWAPAALTYASSFVPAAVSSTVAGWVPASVATTGAAVSSYFAGAPVVAAATATYTGWSTAKVVKSHAEAEANDQVWKLFKSARRLSLAPRVYKAATTRAMKELTAAG